MARWLATLGLFAAEQPARTKIRESVCTQNTLGL